MPQMPVSPYAPAYPVYDLEGSICRTIKEIMMDVPELAVTQPGFVVQGPVSKIVFPMVGVDFRSVTMSGDDGSGHPVALGPEGLVARWEFLVPQAGPITVNPYRTYTTYFAGDPTDLSFDPYNYYGNPLAGSQQQRQVPLAVPIVTAVFPERQAGMGESAQIFGGIQVFSNEQGGGVRQLKAEVRKIYEAIKANLPEFGIRGLQQFRVDPPAYDVWRDKGLVYEGAIKFHTWVKVQ